MPQTPVVGDYVYIHLMVALSILGQVADGFSVRLLVAVDPIEPNLLLLHLLLQQRGLQGGLRVRDQSGEGGREEGRECDIKQLLEKLHTLHSDVKLLQIHISKQTLNSSLRVCTCLKMNE